MKWRIIARECFKYLFAAYYWATAKSMPPQKNRENRYLE